jgi:SAM-dependent methyltransferase
MADRERSRRFFAERAATWEQRFPDDAPAYARAVSELGPPRGARVLDVACGTGRALVPLREAVGPLGKVIGLDLTPEMLDEVIRRGRAGLAYLVRGDAAVLPLADGSMDAIFAAGILSHLGNPVASLREFARVCAPGARLALFHPSGRAALARRHGRTLGSDDVMHPARLRAALTAAGWQCSGIDDGENRYLALARLAP